MAKRQRKGEQEAAPLKLPILELVGIELDGEWCVVSADPAKPLTEEQAFKVVVGYRAVSEMLAGK
jgi:hypothetical protein